MPEKMQELLAEEKTTADRIWKTHIRNAFYNGFTTPVNEKNPDIVWIDYLFGVNSEPAKATLMELNANLFNQAAKNKLFGKLRDAGAFGAERKDFYLWNVDPRHWSQNSYQARSVRWNKLEIAGLGLLNSLPPEFLALGDFTINALPEGYVQPKGNGKYDICVTKMYYFINDSFNFEGHEYLGPWDLNPQYKEPIMTYPYFMSNLSNSSFRRIQDYGYMGVFPVLSRLHEIENFKPVCLEYDDYKKNN